MKHLRLVIKCIAIGFFALLIFFALSPLGKIGVPKKADADSLDAYPSVCLGGWQNPSNASGPPDVPPGDDSFTGDNSAVLDQAQAQIFCGSFQASDESQTPTAVTLHFSWNVIFSSQVSNATSNDPGDPEWSSVLDATSTATSTTTTPAPTPSTTASSSDDQSQSIDPSATSADTSSDNSGGSQDGSVATSTPPPATVSPPAPDSSDSDTSSTSFLQTILSDPLGLLIQKTFAQSVDNDSTTVDTSAADDSSTVTMDASTTTDDSSVDTADDFIDVSYSLDGTTWIDLGPVSESDWQNYSVTIPISSWSDINNLQVQLSPLITSDAPTIYLDGMWLEVDYNNSILNDIENVISDILPTDTLSTSTAPTNSLTPQDATDQNPAPAPLPPPPPPIPQHQYTFTLQGPQSIKVGTLAWYPHNDASGSAPVGRAGLAPTVSLPATNTIEVSGSCSAAYYTILIFPDENDYESNPSLALYNNANKCVNGSFTQMITDLDLPPQLASGIYYLVVANQGVKGPWVPYPETYPIQLSGVSNSASSSQ
jgi:hypothetical protein